MTLIPTSGKPETILVIQAYLLLSGGHQEADTSLNSKGICH